MLLQDWPAAPLAVSPEPRFSVFSAADASSGSGEQQQQHSLVPMFPPGSQGWIATALEEWRAAGTVC
jgi:hypothetical protein